MSGEAVIEGSVMAAEEAASEEGRVLVGKKVGSVSGYRVANLNY